MNRYALGQAMLIASPWNNFTTIGNPVVYF
jgi:hypothetical protein